VPPTTLSHAPAWYSDNKAYIYNFEETHPGSFAIDSGPNANNLPDTTSCTSSTVSVWQGTKSCDWSSAVQGIGCTTSPCQDPFQATTGDWAAGLAFRTGPPGAYDYGMHMGTMGGSSFGGVPGWGLGFDTNASKKLLWEIRWGSNPSYADLDSTVVYTPDTWTTVAVRFTSATKLMEMWVNGLLQTTTATAGSAPVASGRGFGIGAAGNEKYTDEYWFYKGTMTNNDMQRIYVCGWDGATCQCDWAGNPLNYASPPARLQAGMSLPPCNATGP
jgi:hypothetical protein